MASLIGVRDAVDEYCSCSFPAQLSRCRRGLGGPLSWEAPRYRDIMYVQSLSILYRTLIGEADDRWLCSAAEPFDNV